MSPSTDLGAPTSQKVAVALNLFSTAHTHLWVTAIPCRSHWILVAADPYWEQGALSKLSEQAEEWYCFDKAFPQPFNQQGGSDTLHKEGQCSLAPLENY